MLVFDPEAHRPPPGSQKSPQAIVATLHPLVEWVNGDKGWLPCPGKHLHTGEHGKRDCRITLNGPPTIYCFHTACLGVVEEANYQLRRALWEGSPDRLKSATPLTPEERLENIRRRRLEEECAKQRIEHGKLRAWAKDNRERIFNDNAWDPSEAYEKSPVKLGNPADDWRLMLGLYQSSDLLWIGEPTDSGPHAADHFRPAIEWLYTGPKGHFICPSVFTPGTFSRSNANVLRRPYLVVESDTLTQAQMCAVAKWMSTFLPLRAILFTGGKSLHAWFQFPSTPLFEKLKSVLPILGCDPALFKASQPVRLPGVKRDGVWQSLLWFQDTTIL